MIECRSQPGSSNEVSSPKEQSSMPSGTGFKRLVVPADERSTYWAVTLAYLIPVKDDKGVFEERYKALFGTEETALSCLESVRLTIQNYNPLSDVIPECTNLRDLIRETFHDRVQNYMLDRGFEIRAICEMLNATISVSGAKEGEYGNEGTRIQLIDVDLSGTGGARNHYNFGLDENIIDSYQKRLLDDTFQKFDKSFNDNSTDESENDSSVKPLPSSEITFDRETIENVAKIKWYGTDIRHVCKVTSTEDLEVTLEKSRLELENLDNNENVLVVMIDLEKQHWVTLVIEYKENVFHGHYVDSVGQVLPESIKNPWNKIMKEFPCIKDYTTKNKGRSDKYSSGVIAIEDADYIIKCLRKDSKANKQIKKHFQQQAPPDILKKILEKLMIKSKIEDKIKVCSDILSRDDFSKCEKFSSKNFNIFIFFLEAIALEDSSLLGKDYINKFKSKIIGTENSDLANAIRNNLFLHSKHIQKVAVSNIDMEMKKIVKVSCKEFFKNLSDYMLQVNEKLHGVQTLSKKILEPKDLLISKDEMSNISFGTGLSVNESHEELSNLFKEIIKQIGSTPDDKGGDTILFNLLVNVIPILGRLYSDPGSNSRSRNKLSAKGLEQIRKFRNDFLHNFHAKGENNQERNFVLKQGIHDLLDYFFKYYFIREVCKKFNNTSSQKNLRQEISDLLEYTQRDFKNNYYIVEPAVGREDDLSMFVCDYIKLMSVIENEVVKKERDANFKESEQQVLHRKLKGVDRKMIYNLFKDLRKSHTSSGCFEAKALGKKLRIEYGILIPLTYIKQMFEYFVRKRNQLGQFEVTEIVDIVNNDICALKSIARDYPIPNQKIIEMYDMFIEGKDISDLLDELKLLDSQKISINCKLSGLKSKMHKFIDLTSYFEVNDDKGSRIDVIVDVVEMIKNILEMLDDHIEYPFLSINIEDVFTDEVVLDYLLNENINKTEDLLPIFLSVDYIIPYVVKLTTNNKIPLELFTPEKVSNIIEQLLSINHAEYIGNLLDDLTNEQFKQIFTDLELENMKDAVYEEICEKINQDNIRSIYCLLENLDHVKGILKAFNKSNKNELFLEALRKKAFMLYCNEEYDLLGDINDSLENGSSNLDVLQIRRYVALKEKKLGQHEVALKMFETIHDKLEYGNSLFLLVLSDIADTKHLMKDYEASYEKYNYLYDTLIEQLELGSGKLSYAMYDDIIKSEKYRTILALDLKNLNILKIKTSIGFELQHIASAKNPEDRIPDYQKVLNIYEEVYEIIRTDVVFSKYMVQILRRLAYLHEMLAFVVESDQRLNNNNKTLEMYAMMLTVQKKLHWKTHPTIRRTWKNIIKVAFDIAFTNNTLGNSEKYLSSAKAQTYYEKALSIYIHIRRFQNDDIGHTNNIKETERQGEKLLNKSEQVNKSQNKPDNKYCVAQCIGYTNIKLGDLKISSNPEDASRHYEESLKIYETIFEKEPLYKNNMLETLKRSTNPNKTLRHTNHDAEICTLESKNINDIIRNLGYINKQLGNLKRFRYPADASRHYEKALKFYEEIYTSENENHNQVAINLGNINKNLGDLKRSSDPKAARRHCENALRFFKHVQLSVQKEQDEEQSCTFNSDIAIANTYVSIGKIESTNNSKKARDNYKKSMEILQKVLDIQEKTLGADHFQTEKTANLLNKINVLIDKTYIFIYCNK